MFTYRNIIKSFFSEIYQYFLFFLGCVICGYIFYVRVILVRIPRKIEFVWNIHTFLIYIFLMLFFCYLLKRKIYPKESKNEKIIWLKEKTQNLIKIKDIYDESLKKVYIYFIDEDRIPIKNLLKICINKLYN